MQTYQKPQLIKNDMATLARALNDPAFREWLAQIQTQLPQPEKRIKVNYKPPRVYRSRAHGWRRIRVGTV